MGLSSHRRKRSHTVVRMAVTFVLLHWMVGAGSRAGAATSAIESSPGSLIAAAPRQAVLVCYSPSLERLAGAWEVLAPLRQSEDPLLGIVSFNLAQIDEGFLRVWAGRFGLTLNDLARLLPGGVMVGWTPHVSKKEARFESDEWVLVAQRSPGRDQAIRAVWQQLIARVAKEPRIERHNVEGVSIDQVVWEEVLEARLGPKRRPRVPGFEREVLSQREESATFNDVVRSVPLAISLGLSEQYVFFTPSRAQTLVPWIRSTLAGQAYAGPTERVSALMRQMSGTGDVVLALRATPPGWVPSSESAAEKRLGAHPLHVLLSQVRSVEAVLTQRGNQVKLEAQATVLPPPGWIARLLGTFIEGAAVSGVENSSGEISVCADFAQFWKTLHIVLYEGWPVVAIALDLFLGPLSGEGGGGMTQLTTALGARATWFGFRPTSPNEIGHSWAVAGDLRAPDQFAHLEERLERFLENFSYAPIHYQLGPDGRLMLRAGIEPSTAPLRRPRLHVIQWGSHFVAAGSRPAMERAMHAVSNPQPPASTLSPWPLFRESWQGRRPSIVLYQELTPGPPDGMMGDGRMRRTIRTTKGTFELISPPKGAKSDPRASSGAGGTGISSAGPDSGDGAGKKGKTMDPPVATGRRQDAAATAYRQEASSAKQPTGRVVGGIVVESENSVRLRFEVSDYQSQAPGSATPATATQPPPRPVAQRAPTIQE